MQKITRFKARIGNPDTVSRISGPAVEPFPPEGASQGELVGYVRRMYVVYKRMAIIVKQSRRDRLRAAWSMGKGLALVKKQRPHGNTKGQDQTWEQSCPKEFGFSAKTANRWIDLWEVIPEEDLGKYPGLKEAYGQVDQVRPLRGTTGAERDETCHAESDSRKAGCPPYAPQDRVQKKAKALEAGVTALYKEPLHLKSQFNELVQLALNDQTHCDQQESVGLAISEFLLAVTRKLRATPGQILTAISDMEHNLEVSYPAAWQDYQARLVGGPDAHRSKNAGGSPHCPEPCTDESGGPARQPLAEGGPIACPD